MNEYYPYRFKTEEEMINYFGYDWRQNAFPMVGWNSEMDKYLGKNFPLISEYRVMNEIDKFIYEDPYDNRTWSIIPKMLMRNKPKIPSYEPRKISRTIDEQ
jgi:hypothetical protein